MPSQRRERTCIYCEAKADSLEHVIPKWIPVHFGLAGEVLSHERAIGVPRLETVPFGHFASRIYCDTHHRLINRLIENTSTRELIKRLSSGSSQTLQKSDQTRLAAWAAKTCYAQWGMTRRRWGIPVAHPRHLLTHARPHPSVFVSISRCTGDRIRLIFARTELTTPSGVVTHYYDFVLTVGQLALKVWGPTSRSAYAAYKSPTSFATVVWPIRENVGRWPPGRILDDQGVTELWDYDPRALKVSKERR